MNNTLGLKMRRLMVPQSKWNIKCPYSMIPEYITIHNTDNVAPAINEISYMISNNYEVSYHWAVDENEAVQGLEHNRNGWHCGDGGQGTGNRKSIGIEICKNFVKDGDAYYRSDENGAKLAAILLNHYNWGVDRLRQHHDWSGKHCPRRILDENRWESFKQRVQGYLNQLQQPQQNTQPTPNKHQEQLEGTLERYADEVMLGKYGNGQDRVNKLGILYTAVQSVVNYKAGRSDRTTLINLLATETIKGKLGNGEHRKNMLGGLYGEVQSEVNRRFG